jgi:hypothetical protein
MQRALAIQVVAFLCLVLPATAYAQASFSGVVRDTSGAVLPGVTVEASSPVLIEKVRSATTDGDGRYTIQDLRPGTYRMSFTLPGFKTVVRDGIELLGTSVGNVNAELAVGTVEETITVSGQTPAVDLQSTTRQVSITQEIVAQLPSSRNPFALGVLIPGVQQSFGSRDVGGAVVAEVAALAANGGRTGDQRMMVNGVALSSGIAGGWGGGAVPNASGTQEFAIDVSGVDAQAATGGVRVNFIPRDGGNRFSGTLAGSFSRGSFASDNYTGTDVQSRGLSAPSKIKENGEFNPGVGGPLKRDKLWFFVSAKYVYADNLVAGMFFNENANKPNEYRYARSTRQAILHQDQQIAQLRLTYQANPKNKFGMTFDQEAYCGCPFGTTATISPDGSQDRRFPLQRFVTADWTSPVTNKLLLEASGIHRVERWGNMHLQTGKGENLDGILSGITSVTDTGNPVTGGNLTYRSAAQFNNSWNWNIHYRVAASYITGSHNFKVGYNNAYLHHENTTYTDPTTPYSYNFVGGAPSQIVYRITPRTIGVNVDYDAGLFAQDRWTVGRWTVSGGIRFDAFKNSYPEQSVAPTPLAPNLNVRFDKIDNLSWKDITPKMGVTYDLMGNGKTALKFTLNKYLEGMGTTGIGPANVSENANPILRLSGTTVTSSRSWNDTAAGGGIAGDFIPQCDLLNYAPNGECGALTNAATFGTIIGGTNYDADLLRGWGKRQNNWEMTAGVQHELASRVALTVQYARRWYGNFRVTDDTNVTAADYTQFTVNVPNDSRLPNAGGTVTALDLTPTGFARPAQYFVTLAENYGKMTEVYDGVNIGINARLQNGLMLQGGVGPGRVVTDDCDVIDDLPEMLHVDATGNPSRTITNTARPLERCRQNNGWRTGVTGFASYTFPKVDILVSGTFQNQPGVQLNANATTCSSLNPVAACTATTTSLGRTFSGGATRSINVVPAGEVFVERLNQIDLRFAKLFRMAGTRTSVNFDFYNVLNSNAVLTENAVFGAAWRTPQSILLPRLFKLSAQFDF